MKLKKCLLLSFLIIILSGCTNEYNINISDDKIEEELISYIYPIDTQYKHVDGIEDDDKITPFIEGEQYPFSDTYDKVYKKTIEKTNDYTKVSFKYDYTLDEFKNSRTLNVCFDNATYTNTKKYLYIKLENFKCLYSETLDINVKTDNKVMSNNADNKKNNIYTWHIDRDNINDKNIEIKIKKGMPFSDKMMYIGLGILGIIVIINVIFVVRRGQRRNDF